MDKVFNEFNDYLTPYKYGKPILEPSGEEGTFDRYAVDNMRICRHNGKFYCFYIGFDGKGYRTAIAVSDDLINWEKRVLCWTQVRADRGMTAEEQFPAFYAIQTFTATVNL